MADSITPANLTNLPFEADAFLGYVDGRWPDYAAIAAAHGNKPCYGLTVFGNPGAGDGTDSEPGNVSIAGCVTSTKGELARGVDRPIVYCPASWAAQMVAAHTAAGIDRAKYRLLTAHYGGPTATGAPIAGMHICGPATCGYGPGSDGTQWQSLNTYDRSILAPDFLAANPHPGPSAASTPGPAAPVAPSGALGAPIPEQEGIMIQRFQTTTGADGTAYVDMPIPAGTTMLVGGWADVLDATGSTPPRHDLDIHAAHDDPTAAPNGVVCQPCVGGDVPAGHARLRLAGGAPSHFYTGKAVFA
jgi:hypothetical protein